MEDTPERKLAVLLHADVVDSTALVRLNETVAHQRIQDTFQRFSETIATHGGIAHEMRGDALVAEFSKASDAVSASLAFQEANAAHNEELDDDVRPVVRVGIAMGEVVIADNTVTGEGIVLAQRLEQLAKPGGVCIQGATYETVPKRLSFDFKNLGEHTLKGFEEPVKVYAVWGDSGDSPTESKRIVQTETITLALPDKPTIAVLPFENRSDDPEQEYFADGLTEDVITALSKYHWFFVIARNSTFSFKGKTTDVSVIGEALGARYLVEGSVRRAANRIRVTAQLVDSNTGAHIWADHYDRELTDIFEVQDQLTEAIAIAVEPEIGVAERERARTRSSDVLGAWELYQNGMWHYYHFSSEHVALAHELFTQARKQNSNFAPASYGDALAHYIDIVLGFTSNKAQSLRSLTELAASAVSIDERDPMAKVALGTGQYYHGDHAASVETLNRAIALSPNLGVAYYRRGITFVTWNRPRDAIADAQMAERLSPSDPTLWAFYNLRAWAHLSLGEFEECIRWADKATHQPNCQIWPYGQLAVAYHRLGDTDAAQRAKNVLFRMKPDFSIAFMKEAVRFSDVGDHRIIFDGLADAGIPNCS